MQHDQFRTRLDLYCTLTIVCLASALATPVILARSVSGYETAKMWLCCVAFLAASRVSYVAAIASAKGYLGTLQIIKTEADKVTAPSP